MPLTACLLKGTLIVLRPFSLVYVIEYINNIPLASLGVLQSTRNDMELMAVTVFIIGGVGATMH